MAVSEKLKALVGQMPDVDGRGMYTKDIDKERIETAVAAIFEGGRENVQGLIEMLGEPGSPENVKPHYALHCVLNRALIVGDEKARREFCETLAANLSGDLSTYNKAYLCQELQWAGRKEAAPALGNLLTDEQLCDPAGMALVAIRDGAAEQLFAALSKAAGRCRLVVVHSMAALGDARLVGALMQALSDPDREVRLAAGAGLAKIGDPRCVRQLIEAANRATGWERIEATKHCLVLAERLMAGGQKGQAVGIYRFLQHTRTDPSEQYVRDAATKALAAAT
jgi:hypothetical protein